MSTHKCKLCSFTTDVKFNYTRHLQSKKHKDAKLVKKATAINSDIKCDKCGTKFTHLNNLYRHKNKSCKGVMINQDHTNNTTNIPQPTTVQQNIQPNTFDSKYEINEIKSDIKKFTQIMSGIINKINILENEVIKINNNKDDYNKTVDDLCDDVYIIEEKLKPLVRNLDESVFD
jgi:hypothetical protein